LKLDKLLSEVLFPFELFCNWFYSTFMSLSLNSIFSDFNSLILILSLTFSASYHLFVSSVDLRALTILYLSSALSASNSKTFLLRSGILAFSVFSSLICYLNNLSSNIMIYIYLTNILYISIQNKKKYVFLARVFSWNLLRNFFINIWKNKYKCSGLRPRYIMNFLCYYIYLFFLDYFFYMMFLICRFFTSWYSTVSFNKPAITFKFSSLFCTIQLDF